MNSAPQCEISAVCISLTVAYAKELMQSKDEKKIYSTTIYLLSLEKGISEL